MNSRSDIFGKLLHVFIENIYHDTLKYHAVYTAVTTKQKKITIYSRKYRKSFNKK